MHAASLGFAPTYTAASGVRSVDVHEDVFAGECDPRWGDRVVSTGASPVLTIARVTGRGPRVGWPDLSGFRDALQDRSFNRVR